jgi:hypothetical protein
MTNHTATPSTNHTHGTLCANCGETIERQFTPFQQAVREAHQPRTRAAAEALAVLNPAGPWLHLQTGETGCAERPCHCCGIDAAEARVRMCAPCLDAGCLLSSHCDRSTDR